MPSARAWCSAFFLFFIFFFCSFFLGRRGEGHFHFWFDDFIVGLSVIRYLGLFDSWVWFKCAPLR
ncbi:hypothetical protein QBC32DRAFT_338443 [Pseudoneurospora amorphoporcata]|uniref:Uncharacterized protein n=1 Tax=Pseudoneurospora amorphoporcata TaxID=241081 RepID=A0AAN6SHW7_9PEZI|nr:hypothetical protein QBC32DRAFT_338443 [Pseudoneurospora amorphoporcata]